MLRVLCLILFLFIASFLAKAKIKEKVDTNFLKEKHVLKSHNGKLLNKNLATEPPKFVPAVSIIGSRDFYMEYSLYFYPNRSIFLGGKVGEVISLGFTNSFNFDNFKYGYKFSYELAMWFVPKLTYIYLNEHNNFNHYVGFDLGLGMPGMNLSLGNYVNLSNGGESFRISLSWLFGLK